MRRAWALCAVLRGRGRRKVMVTKGGPHTSAARQQATEEVDPITGWQEGSIVARAGGNPSQTVCQICPK